MVSKTTALLLAALCALGFGLDKPQLGGYVENTTSVMGDEFGSVSDIASARLEGSWDYGDKGGVEVHLIASAALQPIDISATFRESSVMERVTMELLTPYLLLADTVAAQMAPSMMTGLDSATAMALDQAMSGVDIDGVMRQLPYSSMYPRDNLAVDRAVVKFFFKPFDLYVGRQMVGWGTGYAWNPTDVWNVKNPADPTAPKLGVNALRLEIPFGAASGLSLVASPGADIDHINGGFRLKALLGRFDVSLSAMRMLTADHSLMGLPVRVMAGGDMAGEIGDFGLWAEGVVVNPTYLGGDYLDFDSLYAQVDLGLNYTFDNGLYLMAEYLYNGLGAWRSEDYSAFDLLHMFAGDMPGLGQHYAMLGATKDLFSDWTADLFILANLTDLSAMVLPGVEWAFHPNLAIKVGGQVSIGDRETSEYGSLYHSGFLKVTGWF